MSKRRCTSDPNAFRYICDGFTAKRLRRDIDQFIQSVYLLYFDIKPGDQDKSWVLHIVCKNCKERLSKWT